MCRLLETPIIMSITLPSSISTRSNNRASRGFLSFFSLLPSSSLILLSSLNLHLLYLPQILTPLIYGFTESTFLQGQPLSRLQLKINCPSLERRLSSFLASWQCSLMKLLNDMVGVQRSPLEWIFSVVKFWKSSAKSCKVHHRRLSDECLPCLLRVTTSGRLAKSSSRQEHLVSIHWSLKKALSDVFCSLLLRNLKDLALRITDPTSENGWSDLRQI